MVETDTQFRIVHPHHDGALHSVSVEGKSAVLHYTAVDGVRRTVVLTGVRDMDVSTFRLGNIIGSMCAVPTERASEVVDKSLLMRFGWGALPTLPPGLILFTLDAAYGAEVIALCEDVTLAEV